MKLQWRIRDIIDLEYFLYGDKDVRVGLDDQDLPHQDRALYRNHINPALPSGLKSIDTRKWILRLWLEHKKKTAAADRKNERILPGESFQTVFRLMLLLVAAAGGLTGSAATLSFLFYQGQSPINVSAFWGIFVLLQMILISATISLLVIRRHMGLLQHVSIAHSLLAALVSKLMLKLRKTSIARIPAAEQNRLLAVIGVVKGKHALYGAAFYWLFFILIQVFSVCLNIGILLTMLLKVTVSDLAFGWQSTIQFSTQAVHQAVVLFARPWSWFVPLDLAHPTMEQIEGSRIILKDGIHHLSTSGMVSWWPFLCLAVLCYGLLPRVILLAAGIIWHKSAMSKIDFNTADCDQLVRNLTTPVISTSGTPVEPLPDRKVAFDPVPDNRVDNLPGPLPDSRIIAIVPDDIDAACPEDALRLRVAQTTGHKLLRKITLNPSPTGSAESIRAVSDALSDHPDLAILVLQEAWQPPIRELRMLLRLIRKTVGNRPIIRIGLIGKPGSETIFTRPAQHDVAVWKQAIAALGDPAMTVDMLGGEKP